MKIEVKYPFEEYKDKLPFEIPKTVYGLDTWYKIDNKKAYKKTQIVGFVIYKEGKQDWICPVTQDYPKRYQELFEDDIIDAYFETEEEARENYPKYRAVHEKEYEELKEYGVEAKYGEEYENV